MNQDWKQLYGPTPESFEASVRRAVTQQPSPHHASRNPGLILVAALVLVLMAGAAIASQMDLISALDDLSIFDLSTGNMARTTPDLTCGADYPYADFSLTEAMTDGYLTWYRLKVTPKAGSVIMPADAQPHYSTQYDSFTPTRQPEGETFKSRALATGGPLVQFGLNSLVLPNQYEDDGSVIITQSTPYTGEKVTISLDLSEISIRASRTDQFIPHEGATASLELSFDLPAPGKATIYAAEVNQWVEALQTTVQRVSFIQTPIAVYLHIALEPGEAVLSGAISEAWNQPYASLLTTMKASFMADGETNSTSAWYPVKDRLHEYMHVCYHLDEIPTQLELRLGYQTSSLTGGALPSAEERQYAVIPLQLKKAE